MIVKPLYGLLKKEVCNDIPNNWTDVHTRLFDEARDALKKACSLAQPDYSLPFIISSDSSGQGCGFSLSQVQEVKLDNGKSKSLERPLQWGSHAWIGLEITAGASEKELLGLYYAVRKFRGMLRFTKLIIRVEK